MTDQPHEAPGHPHGGHDHSSGGHDHGPGGVRGFIAGVLSPHSHDAAESIDTALTASAEGIRALKISNAFGAGSEEAVQPLADIAAEAIGTSPLYAFALDMVEGLVETLESQSLINQAAGAIMAGEGRTAEEALDRLRQLSLASGKPMRVVAQLVLEERPTPPPPLGDSQMTDPHEA